MHGCMLKCLRATRSGCMVSLYLDRIIDACAMSAFDGCGVGCVPVSVALIRLHGWNSCTICAIVHQTCLPVPKCPCYAKLGLSVPRPSHLAAKCNCHQVLVLKTVMVLVSSALRSLRAMEEWGGDIASFSAPWQSNFP